MNVLDSEVLEIRASEDIVAVRQAVRKKAVAMGFGIVDQTKIVTASSELARNTLDYGGGGTLNLERVENGIRTGLRLVFSGPGSRYCRHRAGVDGRLYHRDWHGARIGRGQTSFERI